MLRAERHELERRLQQLARRIEVLGHEARGGHGPTLPHDLLREPQSSVRPTAAFSSGVAFQ